MSDGSTLASHQMRFLYEYYAISTTIPSIFPDSSCSLEVEFIAEGLFVITLYLYLVISVDLLLSWARQFTICTVNYPLLQLISFSGSEIL